VVYSSLTEDSRPVESTEAVRTWFSHKNAPSLQITSLILEATANFYSIYKDKAVAVPQDKVSQIGEFLLTYKRAGQLDELYYFLLGLSSLVESRLPNPVVLSVNQGIFKLSSKNEPLQVAITDFRGKSVASDVTLNKALSLTDKTNLLSRRETLSPSGLDFLKFNPSPGVYQLEFSAQPKDNNYVGFRSAPRVVKVLTRATISNLRVVVGETGEDRSKKRLEVQYPRELSEELAVSGSQRLQLSLDLTDEKGKPLHVQQVAVVFTHLETNQEAVLIVPDDSTLGSYRVTLALDKIEQAQLFHSKSGKYSIQVIVGDSIIENPTSWKVGTASLQFRTPSGSSVDYQPNEVKLNTDLPVLHHTFRPADKRAPHIVSFTFTLLVLSPLLILFVGLVYYRANISNFPFGLGFIDAVGFQLCLLAILGLFGLFWLELTMVTALKYLTILSLPTVFFGQRNLRRIATSKLKA